jgi:translation elongation factor EF-G
MQTLNRGIPARADAGKTSLTEPLLAAGVIDQVGSIGDGSTRADSLAWEHRGGTIKSAASPLITSSPRWACGRPAQAIRRAAPAWPAATGLASRCGRSISEL